MRYLRIALVVALGFLAVGQHAWAFDSAEVYRQGALMISGEAGYGAELHLYDTFTRFQHVSNAYTSSPNVGINSNSGVVGVSYFFK